jgi:hypothetical protein
MTSRGRSTTQARRRRWACSWPSSLMRVSRWWASVETAQCVVTVPERGAGETDAAESLGHRPEERLGFQSRDVLPDTLVNSHMPRRIAVQIESIGVFPPSRIAVGCTNEHQDLLDLGTVTDPSAMSRVAVRKKVCTGDSSRIASSDTMRVSAGLRRNRRHCSGLRRRRTARLRCPGLSCRRLLTVAAAFTRLRRPGPSRMARNTRAAAKKTTSRRRFPRRSESLRLRPRHR